MTRWVALLLVGVVPLQAQAPRYSGALLRCAVYAEHSTWRIASRSGTAMVEDRSGRDGVLVVTVADSLGRPLVTAWYDSLSVWRETGAGREAPATDGIVGGRYQGWLGPDGRYDRVRVPFVPAELGNVTDLAAALDDFLPRLAPVSLEPGARWHDSLGFEVRRLDDGEEDGQRVERYRWRVDRRDNDRIPAGDSLAVRLEQRIEEEGELTWSRRWGPLTWRRSVHVDAVIPAREGVKRALATRIEREVRVIRLAVHPACPLASPRLP